MKLIKIVVLVLLFIEEIVCIVNNYCEDDEMF